MVDHTELPHPIGWFRAILTAVVIAGFGIAALVYGANAALTKVHGLNRSSLVGITTTMFFIVLIALGWALRWLQRRNVI